MRILHVAESIKGGCGTYLDQIVPHQLADRQIGAVRVIAPEAHVAQLGSVPRDVVVTFGAKERSATGLVSLALALRRELASYRPDVVHLHSTFAGIVGRIIPAFAPGRPRLIYCAHGWAFDVEAKGWKQRAVASVERMLAPLADRIVAISEYERRRGIEVGISPSRIITVWNGLIDRTPPAEAAPARPRRLLFIGRLDRQKGYDILLQAVAELAGQVELRMAGAAVVGDQDVGAWPSHVTSLGWLGPDRIAEELAWCDLVVVPSRWEGFGLVALEAMRAGRAVLATRVGGLPEVVADGETGMLIEPGDAATLRAAILALDDRALCAMGSAGRERFTRHFTIDRTLAGLDAVYRAVV